MIRFVREEWLPRNPDGPIRLLSAPCSTGEEPYSLVMALLDAGLPARRIRVDAIDISERALERARHGVYAKNAFRGVDLGFRERHFEITGEGARISDVVRDCVHFQQGNLLDTGLLAAAPVYGVIYSRNLLIYFDPPAQRRAAQALRRMLSPAGWLFVGPSEPPLLTAHGFALARLPMAFALRAPLEQSAPPGHKNCRQVRPVGSAARCRAERDAIRESAAGRERPACTQGRDQFAGGGAGARQPRPACRGGTALRRPHPSARAIGRGVLSAGRDPRHDREPTSRGGGVSQGNLSRPEPL